MQHIIQKFWMHGHLEVEIHLRFPHCPMKFLNQVTTIYTQVKTLHLLKGRKEKVDIELQKLFIESVIKLFLCSSITMKFHPSMGKSYPWKILRKLWNWVNTSIPLWKNLKPKISRFCKTFNNLALSLQWRHPFSSTSALSPCSRTCNPPCLLQLIFSHTPLSLSEHLMLFWAGPETKKKGIKYKLQVILHCSFFTFCFGSSMMVLPSSWQFTILQLCKINQGPSLISCFKKVRD